ncbi:MAG: protein kinase [Proteobacteria bacterium]|nr:protein kinase [Pseudomonadota bacterium]
MGLPESTTILETLGEGSFGTVYVARVEEGALARTLVLKVLKASWADNPEILTRARDEAVLLARLNHDNIVRVEQLTEIEGRPAVVMEHVQGLTLDQIVRAHGPFPVGVAVAIVQKIASALDAAYNRAPPGEDEPLRVVHRDIKPSNIIVSVAGAVKVLDFGTARADYGAREARTSSLTMGSPLYMSPEAYDGLESNPAVDIYALGATLYELVAGVAMGKLSVDPDRHAERKKERIGELRSPTVTDAATIKAVRKLVEKCVRYKPDRRPTAADMKRLCGEFLMRMPRGTMNLDQFAESVVEPAYRKRERLPHVPIEPTMSDSALRGRTHVAPPPPPPPPARKRSMVVPIVLGVAVALAAVFGLSAAFLVNTTPAPEPAITQPTDEGPSRREQELEQRRRNQERAAKARPEEAETPREEPRAPVVTETRTEPATETRTEPETPAVEEVPPVEEPVEIPSGLPVTVRLVSLPAGAQIDIQGQSITTPGSGQFSSGVSTVGVTFPTGENGPCSVQLSAGAQLAFRITDGLVSCP